MLLKHEVLRKIAAGQIELVYRRWRRPTVRAGGTLRTAVGELSIDAVDAVSLSGIRKADALRAGYGSVAELRDELAARDGTVYRITVRLAGPDRRISLRSKKITTAADMAELQARLDRMDEASRDGPWTAQVLRLISDRPEVRAVDLAASLGGEKKPFKLRVRKLKELGLTESLEVGYRLSPRGRSYLRKLAKR